VCDYRVVLLLWLHLGLHHEISHGGTFVSDCGFGVVWFGLCVIEYNNFYK